MPPSSNAAAPGRSQSPPVKAVRLGESLVFVPGLECVGVDECVGGFDVESDGEGVFVGDGESVGEGDGVSVGVGVGVDDVTSHPAAKKSSLPS